MLKKVSLLLLLLNGFCLAQSLAGKWTGSAAKQREYGTELLPITLVLAQSGGQITGTINFGSNDVRLENAQLKNGTLTFSVKPGSSVITFTLASSNGHLQGQLSTDTGDGRTVDLTQSN